MAAFKRLAFATLTNLAVALLAFFVCQSVCAIEIVVDYTYDTNDFFNTAEKRAAIEAAAARLSRVIDSELAAAEPTVNVTCSDGVSLCPAPWRIGFPHPSTGEIYQISTAINAAADPVPDPANEYGFAGLEENQWLLFVGGRSLSAAAVGGTATGLNFTDVFDDPNGPMHRGVIANTPSNTVNDLPTWGGAVAFDTGQDWHFGLETTSVPGDGSFDFYSIALHEIAHALGASAPWNQFRQHIVNGIYYNGANAIAAYNEDNGTNVTQLQLVNSGDPHWADTSSQQSFIFTGGEPLWLGTTGDELQDLIMDPVANFTQDIRRFELTNVDVASLVDIGWSIIDPVSTDPLDLNGDTVVNAADVDLACSNGDVLGPYFERIGSLVGDVDLNGSVQFADFLILSTYFGRSGPYSQGDITCDGEISFGDFLLLSTYFGDSVSASVSHRVPESNAGVLLFIGMLLLATFRRVEQA